VLRALREEPGSVLAFLPGQAEIARAASALAGQVPKDCEVVALYGDMEGAAQDAAIRPAPPGRRKVVLATSIAETSLTIEGVRVVVDSGLSRTPRFDVASGMGRLETVRVSRASADQRRGRAGRVEPGVCFRLWSEGEDQRLAPHSVPEILEADLVPLALELASWGARDARALAWLDPPKEASLAQARELLVELGALEPVGAAAAAASGLPPLPQEFRITAHGRALLKVPLHPRLAHLCLRGKALGLGAVACELAAVLADRDPIRTAREAPDADLRLRVAALRDRALPGHPLPPGARVDDGRRQQARQLARDLMRRLGASPSDAVAAAAAPSGDDLDAVGLLVALAYPDRLAQARGDAAKAGFRMRNGRGAHFAHADALARQPWLAIAQLDGAGADARIFLAAPLELADVERVFGEQIEAREVGGWDDAAGAVVARRERRLGALTIASQERRDLAPERVVEGLIAGIRARGLGVLPWTEALQAFRQRAALMRRVDGAKEGDPGAWPDLSDERLLATLEDWLAPYLAGRSRLAHLAAVPLGDALRGLLDHRLLRELDAQCPTHWTVPSGSVKPIDYSTDEPVLAVRLQEMFGATDTPRIARGRVPLTLHLLSPAGRPVQVTKDLAGFWRSAYFEVRKDLRGRYPKHHWPEDPLAAQPTARAKRRT
jgi:ATP-dependent helicase HrpB